MLDPTTINHAPHRTAPRTPEMTEKALREATRRIAPLWPLDRFVAVNPYVGLVDLGVAEAAARLAATAGARGTLPPAYYLSAVDEGRITIADLQAAMAAADPAGTDTVDVFVDRCRAAAPGMDPQPSVPTVTRTATAVTGSDWARFSVERIAAWAAAYFDDGQAAWRSADRAQRPYASWLEEATADRTPEVMGLRGFRAVMRSLPGEPLAAAHIALEHLDVPDELLDTYLHAVLLQVGGWAAHAARIAFEADLAGQPDDDTLVQFLAIVLAWEHGLLRTLSTQGLSTAWTDAIHCASPDAPQPGLADKLVLQDALDRAERRRIAAQLSAPGGREHSSPGRAEAQAIFCIDVRSETYRRHLETGGDIETLGFAGFFGFAVTYVPLAHQHGAAQYPVLLTSGPTVVEVLADPATTDAAVARRRLAHHVARAWKSFKMGAVSCFSFVGPVGLGYLPKLFTDSYGRTRPIPTADVEGLGPWATGHKGPSLDASTSPSGPTGAGIGPEDRIRLAEGALRGLSLRTGLAPLVLIAGHGASTVNNPYETGLNCGACGGNTGEANARVAAAVQIGRAHV